MYDSCSKKSNSDLKLSTAVVVVYSDINSSFINLWINVVFPENDSPNNIILIWFGSWIRYLS